MDERVYRTSFVRALWGVLGLGSNRALKASRDVSLGRPDVVLMAMGRWIE